MSLREDMNPPYLIIQLQDYLGWDGLLNVFYGTSILVSYLMLNPVFYIYDLQMNSLEVTFLVVPELICLRIAKWFP